MYETIIIKLGGSMISKSLDELIDFDYLSKLKELFVRLGSDNRKFIVITGGGFLMRHCRDLAKANGLENEKELHWIGTTVNVLHAQIVKSFWYDVCDEDFLKYEDYYDDRPIVISKMIKTGGGGRPGHSGDLDAILACLKSGAKNVLSLKNVDGVYDSDPKENSDAKRQASLTWDEYMQIIGNLKEHKPGANFPIDPIASRLAKEKKLCFKIMLGGDLESLENAITGKDFTGTVVC